jgi:hypothetical protein
MLIEFAVAAARRQENSLTATAGRDLALPDDPAARR